MSFGRIKLKAPGGILHHAGLGGEPAPPTTHWPGKTSAIRAHALLEELDAVVRSDLWFEIDGERTAELAGLIRDLLDG